MPKKENKPNKQQANKQKQRHWEKVILRVAIGFPTIPNLNSVSPIMFPDSSRSKWPRWWWLLFCPVLFLLPQETRSTSPNVRDRGQSVNQSVLKAFLYVLLSWKKSHQQQQQLVLRGRNLGTRSNLPEKYERVNWTPSQKREKRFLLFCCWGKRNHATYRKLAQQARYVAHWELCEEDISFHTKQKEDEAGKITFRESRSCLEIVVGKKKSNASSSIEC